MINSNITLNHHNLQRSYLLYRPQLRSKTVSFTADDEDQPDVDLVELEPEQVVIVSHLVLAVSGDAYLSPNNKTW